MILDDFRDTATSGISPMMRRQILLYKPVDMLAYRVLRASRRISSDSEHIYWTCRVPGITTLSAIYG